MRETQMLLGLGYTPKPRRKGLAAPPSHEREGLRAYDRELGGTVPVKKLNGEPVRDTRKSPFSTKL